MKKLIKKHSKVVLFAGVCLFSCEVFSASEATKRMIHDTLSKYCIPPKKENCNPSQEGQYDSNYDFCLCNDDGMIYNKSDRICKDCRAGTYYKRNMKDNKCKSCSPGTYSGSGAASCTNCPAGSYAFGYGNSACSSCWAGSYQPNSGQSGCLSCDSSSCMTSGTGATSCYFRCGGYTPYCSSGSCVECTSDSHCSGSDLCRDNSCVSYCSVYDCSPPSSDGDNNNNSGGGSGSAYDCYDEKGGYNSCGGSCYDRKTHKCSHWWRNGPWAEVVPK